MTATASSRKSLGSLGSMALAGDLEIEGIYPFVDTVSRRGDHVLARRQRCLGSELEGVGVA